MCSLFLLSLFVQTVHADEQQQAQTKTYQLDGIVKGIDRENKLLTLDHKEIPGFMEAMTMDFPVSDENLLKTLHTGDHVQGTLVVKGLSFTITALSIVPANGT
jgi:protein SCO1/2